MKFTQLVLATISVAFASIFAPASAESQSWHYPVIENYGKVQSVPQADMALSPDRHYRVLMDLTKGAGKPDKVGDGLAFPAHAGMIRQAGPAAHGAGGVPRARGNDPEDPGFLASTTLAGRVASPEDVAGLAHWQCYSTFHAEGRRRASSRSRAPNTSLRAICPRHPLTRRCSVPS